MKHVLILVVVMLDAASGVRAATLPPDDGCPPNKVWKVPQMRGLSPVDAVKRIKTDFADVKQAPHLRDSFTRSKGLVGRVVESNPHAGTLVCGDVQLYLYVGKAIAPCDCAPTPEEGRIPLMPPVENKLIGDAERVIGQSIKPMLPEIRWSACGKDLGSLPAGCKDAFVVDSQWPPKDTPLRAQDFKAMRLRLALAPSWLSMTMEQRSSTVASCDLLDDIDFESAQAGSGAAIDRINCRHIRLSDQPSPSDSPPNPPPPQPPVRQPFAPIAAGAGGVGLGFAAARWLALRRRARASSESAALISAGYGEPSDDLVRVIPDVPDGGARRTEA